VGGTGGVMELDCNTDCLGVGAMDWGCLGACGGMGVRMLVAWTGEWG
jgi:hypothetical protein